MLFYTEQKTAIESRLIGVAHDRPGGACINPPCITLLAMVSYSAKDGQPE